MCTQILQMYVDYIGSEYLIFKTLLVKYSIIVSYCFLH